VVAKGEKPKRASLPPGYQPADVDLGLALRILALPREVGIHGETREMVLAGIGRYGPYLKHGAVYKNIPAGDDVLTIGINRATELLAGTGARPGRAPAAAARVVGDHPKDKKPVTLHAGRYGPYVKHGQVMASLPKSVSADELTLEQAVDLLAAKAGKGKPAKAKAAANDDQSDAPKAKAPAKKPAAKAKTSPKAKTSQKAKAAKAPEAAPAKAAPKTGRRASR
jgi:DNA topoisomerase-1